MWWRFIGLCVFSIFCLGLALWLFGFGGSFYLSSKLEAFVAKSGGYLLALSLSGLLMSL